MTTGEISYSFEESGIRVVRGEHSTRIIWLGVWDLRVPDLGIGPFFKSLMPSLSGKKVIVDFCECEYINSSSINTLFQLVKDLNAKELDTELLYNATVEWQRITFRSVKTVTQTLPHIHVTAN